jgi:hypothetical protein
MSLIPVSWIRPDRSMCASAASGASPAVMPVVDACGRSPWSRREGSPRSHAPESYLEQFEADNAHSGTDTRRARARIDVESASVRARTGRCGFPSSGVKPAGNIGRLTMRETIAGFDIHDPRVGGQRPVQEWIAIGFRRRYLGRRPRSGPGRLLRRIDGEFICCSPGQRLSGASAAGRASSGRAARAVTIQNIAFTRRR